MAIDPSAFREAFPEFFDEDRYTDAMISFWGGVADARLNTTRWGDLITHGQYLFVAHHITISAQEKANAQSGVVVGSSGRLISSKGVGDVSVSYDNNAMQEDGGGNYNLTFYGREFLRLARIVGIGGIQLNGDEYDWTAYDQ